MCGQDRAAAAVGAVEALAPELAVGTPAGAYGVADAPLPPDVEVGGGRATVKDQLRLVEPGAPDLLPA